MDVVCLVFCGDVLLKFVVLCIVVFKFCVMQKLFGGNYDCKLFVKLCKLCKVIVDEENILLYVVFNDVMLIEMVEQMLVFVSEMLSVNGVGMCKLECFGKEFMVFICVYVDGDDEEQLVW